MAFPILGALKLAAQAGSHIYKKRQETKMLMADAQMMHAQIIRGKTIGLERRICSYNFVGSNNGFNLGCCIRRP